MAGIDGYMAACWEEDEESDRRARREELELNFQSRQIEYEADVRAGRPLGIPAPPSRPSRAKAPRVA